MGKVYDASGGWYLLSKGRKRRSRRDTRWLEMKMEELMRAMDFSAASAKKKKILEEILRRGERALPDAALDELAAAGQGRKKPDPRAKP